MQLESKWEKEEGYNHIWEIMDNNKGNAVLFFYIFFLKPFYISNPAVGLYLWSRVSHISQLTKKQVIT